MPSTTDKTSTITLKLYVDLLHRASLGNLEPINDLVETEKRAARELLNSGLISDGKIELGGISLISNTVITPEGASSLESWSSYLRQESKWNKAGDALIRFGWVLIGALAASTTEIIKVIFK